ncbi:uncharacterized protein LY89DRAFT_783645 [Mollisia scopiformis]|uniref:NAD(P)-binding domain-containing protein n=1 Tax=Mollisia scopiformis TaxID=149040 RepID=A0A194X5Q3_MOLSC|nr:uncharacterized protein LY89DRAFT_783645 [Mollisia scopiformis]KUJ15513.1 hypothetical protein LY89DRAFT_783645 [Mollisia scopiformis]
MRILLLGGTGNLGRRLIPALLSHNHTLTLLLRNPSKLTSLITPNLHALISAIETGDATDAAAIKRTLVAHDIEAIINVAGDQVRSGEEWVLPKIAKAVTEAAIQVSEERGKGRELRVWITCGLGIAAYPGTGRLIQDFLPKFATQQHNATLEIVERIPVSSLRWSLLAIAMMYPLNADQGPYSPITEPKPHGLQVGAGSPPRWKDHWLGKLWWVGLYLNVWRAVLGDYCTHYENVADFLAEDVQRDGEEWVGKRVVLWEDWGV